MQYIVYTLVFALSLIAGTVSLSAQVARDSLLATKLLSKAQVLALDPEIRSDLSKQLDLHSLVVLAYELDSSSVATTYALACHNMYRDPAFTASLLEKTYQMTRERFVALQAAEMWGLSDNAFAASKIYKSLLEKDPDDIDLLPLYEEALTHYLRQHQADSLSTLIPSQMEQEYQTLSAISQRSNTSLAYLGTQSLLLRVVGKKAEMIALYERELERDPHNISLGMELATQYIQVEELARAEALIAQLQKEDPQNAHLRLFEALLQLQQKKYDGFAHAMGGYVSLTDKADIDEILSNFDRMRSSLYGEEYQRASIALKPLYEQLHKQHPGDARITSEVALLHSMSGDTIQAVQMFSELVRSNTTIQPPYDYLLVYHEQRKDTAQLLDIALKAIELFPKEERYYVAALSPLWITQHDKVPTIIKRALEHLNPSSSLYLFLACTMGDILTEDGNFEAARLYYDKATGENSIPVAYNNYAYALARYGSKDELNRAEELASKAVRLEGNNASYLDTYAWILYLKGEYKLAKIYIEAALRHSEEGNNATQLEHYAEILEALDERAEALKVWQQRLEVGETTSEEKQAIQQRIQRLL